MQNIEQKALEIFNKNIEYLSKEQPNTYKKVFTLQQAIESGQYQENYALEYKDGYFDVKNLKDNTWFYDMDSSEFAKQRADEVTYEKMDKSISLMNRYLYTDAMLEDFAQMSAINLSLALTAPVEQEVTYAGGQQKMMKRIYKFAFLGIGLGTHIGKIDEKIKAESYLLVENNLEIFYLSLFVTDYAQIAQKARLCFAIMSSELVFKQVFVSFYKDMVMRNDFLKFCILTDEYNDKIKQMQSNVLAENYNTYPSGMFLRKNLRISKILKEEYKFLNISQIYKDTIFSRKKVLFLAAGPSLNKYIKWIKENQDKFIIISVFAIAGKLEKEGIIPDIFVHIDELKKPLYKIVDNIDNLECFKNTIFLLSPSVYMDFFNSFVPKENIYLVQDRVRYKENFGYLNMYSVGEASSMLAILLGSMNLYMIGFDLALNQKTGSSHTEKGRGVKIDLKSQKLNGAGINFYESLLLTKGNKQDTVYTTPLFESSLQIAREWNNLNITNQRVYNLSDGAFVDKTIPFNVEDIIFDSKDSKVSMSEIKEFMDSKSSSKLSEKEKENIEIRKKEVLRNVKLVKKFTKAKIKEKDDFHRLFVEMIAKTLIPINQNFLEISTIFTIYLTGIAGYVGEYLNTEDADYSVKTLKKIRDCIATQLNKLFHGIGLWEFNFIEPYEFFNNQENRPYETIVYNYDYKYLKTSLLNRVRFSIEIDDDFYTNNAKNEKMIPLDKEIIGFFMLEESLNATAYVLYVKEMLKDSKNENFTFFYFEEEDRKKAEEKIDSKKVKYVRLKKVEDILENANFLVFYSIGKDIMVSIERQIREYFETYFPKIKLVKTGEKSQQNEIAKDE